MNALELERPSLSGRGLFRCDATLTIDGATHVVAPEMISPYRRFWLAFFDDLAACESGWSGTKKWSSEFGELTLEALNNGDEVWVDVTLLAPEPTADEPCASSRLRSGELGRVRDELAGFLRLKT